jgi:sec-independent protein translocase protein TatB
VFGLSFPELVVIGIVAFVFIGPQELPRVMRKLGQWSAQLRRMALDLRSKSGIDDVLHAEGLSENIHEIRKLARGQLDSLGQAAALPRDLLSAPDATGPTANGPSGASEGSGEGPQPSSDGRAPGTSSSPYDAYPEPARALGDPQEITREREYPSEGADQYGALPDHAVVYADFPASAAATDPVYTAGVEAPAWQAPQPLGTETPPPYPHAAAEALASAEGPDGTSNASTEVSTDGTSGDAPHGIHP